MRLGLLCLLLLAVASFRAALAFRPRLLQRSTPLRALRAASVNAGAALSGLSVIDVATGEALSLKEDILSRAGPTALVLGTYAADFNAIEYGQRVSYYLPALKAKGVEKVIFLLNASPKSCLAFKEVVGLADEAFLVSDTTGAVGRAFGVNRGWRPDDRDTSPYLKLFGMLWGLGAVMTLPSVIGGYIGNPFTRQPWIEAALADNQRKGIWPDTALELDSGGAVLTNKFSELPVVGGWGRRPLELATLRLQNMLGLSLKHWDRLKPTDEELDQGLLTQLGGLVVLRRAQDQAQGELETLYQWRDDGICDVCNFETLLKRL